MEDRLQLLREAKQIAYEMIDISSALSNEGLAQYRKEGFTDQEIIAELAGEFLEEADYYFLEVKDEYATEE